MTEQAFMLQNIIDKTLNICSALTVGLSSVCLYKVKEKPTAFDFKTEKCTVSVIMTYWYYHTSSFSELCFFDEVINSK